MTKNFCNNNYTCHFFFGGIYILGLPLSYLPTKSNKTLYLLKFSLFGLEESCSQSLNSSVPCLFLHRHRLPQLDVEEDRVDSHHHKEPDVQTVQRRKVVNDSWSFGNVG